MTYDEKLAFLRRYRDAQRTMRRLLEELAQLLAGPVNVRCLYYMPTAAEAANGWTGRSPAGTIFWPTRWRGRGDTNERRPNHEKDSNLV